MSPCMNCYCMSRVRRRGRDRPTGLPGHAGSHPVCDGVPDPSAPGQQKTGFRRPRRPDLLRTGPAEIPLPGPGLRGHRPRRQPPLRAECGQRSGGGGLPSGQDRLL